MKYVGRVREKAPPLNRDGALILVARHERFELPAF